MKKVLDVYKNIRSHRTNTLHGLKVGEDNPANDYVFLPPAGHNALLIVTV